MKPLDARRLVSCIERVPVAPRPFPWLAVALGALATIAVVVLSYVGWSFALGLVLAGATWSVR